MNSSTLYTGAPQSGLMSATPNIYTLVKGTGEARLPLNAFDQALLDAGVGDTNLVRMSSIVPPGCRPAGQVDLPKGALVPVAYGEITSQVPGQTISAAVALALPEDPQQAGVIMEYEAASPLSEVEAIVRRMAEDAFAYRNRKIGELQSIGAEHTVQHCGAAFAGAVMWYDTT